MSVNVQELAKSEFWQKKIATSNRVRDLNGDGFISRADFEMISQNYKDMGTSEEHLKKLNKNVDDLCVSLGLKDENTKLTHEEIVANFAKSDVKVEDLSEFYTSAFEAMDSDGNGTLSFKEWVDWYKANDIETAYARPSFDALDTNHDGVISKEEFYEYNKEFFYSKEDKLHSSIMFGPLV